MKTFWKSVGAIAVVVGSLLASQAAEAKLKVAMVTSESGLGDRSFNDMMNAISSGGLGANSAAAQSLSSPSAAASATGGDPVGAASGTQSSTTPGSAPANLNQPQPGQGQQQNEQLPRWHVFPPSMTGRAPIH